MTVTMHHLRGVMEVPLIGYNTPMGLFVARRKGPPEHSLGEEYQL